MDDPTSALWACCTNRGEACTGLGDWIILSASLSSAFVAHDLNRCMPPQYAHPPPSSAYAV